MKFGKEFASQMVQEWQEAYMAYNYLKTLLKDISHFRQRNASSLYRAFSGLTSRCNNLRLSPKKNNEGEVILVSAVQEEGSPEGNYYETMFLMSSDEGGEYELVFFRRLDDEFNKVIKFYREKVKELIKEAEELNKKMDALIALRIKVDKPVIVSTTSQEINESKPCNGRTIISSALYVYTINHTTKNSFEALFFQKCPNFSTLKNIIMSSKSDLSFSKQELRKVEEKMRQAFIEFYQKLRLLKSYCFLNQLAFSKIMKKYDKITSRNASKAYLEMVDKSFIGTCDEIHFFCSLFGYIVLHMIMYAGNTYFWKRFRINYPFLFGFKLGTELGYGEVLLLGSGLAIHTLAGVISNLDMDMDPRIRSFRTITELVPLGLVTVTLPDFFLADQFTSQVQALRSLEFYVCYYGWEDFKRRSNKCNQSDTFKNFCIVVSVIPYWLCSLQVLDVMLRLAWMQSVLGLYEAPFLYRTAVIAIVPCLEIIHRGIWNFFRLENEHLTNVGKYQVFKSVPLPFNYDDEEKHTS
ncbi:hypothetical protein HYC85_003013 [Camellia sinensis]|uniref:SPX domain-containing protein n=1 Tax=Camellia sinensis TaxID=4442 RepID=A0A7J7IBJ9_CAMSI|nr:hypothetical protein HYC85_003013 [Camellia sinensis]